MIKDFFNWLGKSTVTQLAEFSYWPCMIVCIAAMLLYIAGQKKAGKYVPTSVIIYFLLQCFKAAVK